MSELARLEQVPRCWIERRIWNGTIAVAGDAAAKRYLFPDIEETIAALQRLKSGQVDHLDFAPNTSK